MAKKLSAYFEHNSVSTFKVYECYELDNYDQTPKSSRVQKKLFNDSNDKVLQKVSWGEACLTNRAFQLNNINIDININSTKTPPMIKSPFQPLAPTKPRRFTDKTELKPKKLVFKDVEESESDMADLSTIYGVKSDDKVLHEIKSSSSFKVSALMSKNDLRAKANRRNMNDNKENNMQYHYFDDKDLNGNNKSVIKKGSLTQKKNSNVKPGVIVKHLRV